jgi:integrase
MPLFDAHQQPVRTLTAAKQALDIKRHERRENKLPTAGRKPSLKDYCIVYFDKSTVQRKRTGTINNERQALARWCDYIGHVRVDQITTALITGFVEKRLKGGVFCGRRLERISERTANLDVLMLRNVLNAAIDEGLLRDLPRIKMLDEPKPPKRPLLMPDEFERLIESSRIACAKNGRQLADYLQFLAYSGSREKEALRIRIADVDLERQRVLIGGDGLSKNRESRTVEFNARLAALLTEMFSRRPPDSGWLFPSPQRGKRDEHAKSFRESLKIARKAADLEWLGFHDLRHYFCSMCVMAGIDFMTIAAWLGHKDGGILVGKVYGHLLDEHRRKAAERVSFSVQY